MTRRQFAAVLSVVVGFGLIAASAHVLALCLRIALSSVFGGALAASLLVSSLTVLALAILWSRLLQFVRFPWRFLGIGPLTAVVVWLCVMFIAWIVPDAPSANETLARAGGPLAPHMRTLLGEPAAPSPIADVGDADGANGAETNQNGTTVVDAGSAPTDKPSSHVAIEYAWKDADGNITVSTDEPPPGAEIISRRKRRVNDDDGSDEIQASPPGTHSGANTKGGIARPSFANEATSTHSSTTTSSRTQDARVLEQELRNEINVLRGSPSTYANAFRRDEVLRTRAGGLITHLESTTTKRPFARDIGLDAVAKAGLEAALAGAPSPFASRLRDERRGVESARELRVSGKANAAALVQNALMSADRNALLSRDFLGMGVRCDVAGDDAQCLVDLATAF